MTLPPSVPSILDSPAIGPPRATEPPLPKPGLIPRTDDWLNSHRGLIVGSDAAVIIFAVLVAQFIGVDADFRISFGWAGSGFAWLFAIVVAASWLVLLAAEGVWVSGALKNRRSDRRRILLASLMEFAGVGIIGYLTGTDSARAFLLISAPLGIAGLIVNHWRWRRRFIASHRTADHRYGVVVHGDRTDTVGAMSRSTSGGVAVAAPLALDRPSGPTLSGRQLIAKRALDLAVAVISILLLAPLLVAAAVMVVLADGGPVLHQQEYVERAGKVFKGWTFRCTPYGAKARPALAGAMSGRVRPGEYDVPTTAVGRLLRRTGLACAPGLFNVLAGHMSIVGPKPVAPGDVTPVTVRPGLTGPWRLSDPSDITTGIEVRSLQNFSVGGDIKIIGRSLKLAVTGRLPD